LRVSILFIALAGIFGGCASYKQSIMFNTSETTALQQQAAQTLASYPLAEWDVVTLKVFTKNGERIIDPDDILLMQNGNAQMAAGGQTLKTEPFTINELGIAKLPMLGDTKLAGLTLREAELLLQKQFAQYYENVFVTLQCISRRVTVLGAPGGRVLPLAYENISVVELLALSSGLPVDGKVQNIRLLRGNEVYRIDLSTVEGYQKTNMIVLPGDIVYVEPVRRPLLEATRDYGQIFSLAFSFAVLLLTLTR
jgi:polysaccharide biosynthesis/export protein